MGDNYLLHSCENVGFGFPKIIAAWKETNWGEPQLINKLDVDEVELVLPVPSPKSTVKTVNETVNETVKISEYEAIVLDLIQKDNSVTYQALIQITKLSRATIARIIKKLQDNGFIHRKGSDKNGIWEIINK